MVSLNAGGIWRLFCQTGDPALFVMMKRTERQERRKDTVKNGE